MFGLDRNPQSAQGRFTSPDLPLYAQHPAEPQSWNLYSYTANNPLAGIDPDGRNWFNIGGAWQWHEGSDVNNDGGPCKKGAKGCNHSDYTHLLVATPTGTNNDGATTYSLTLYNQKDVAFQGEAVSGGRLNRGPQKSPTKPGNYEMRTDVRDNGRLVTGYDSTGNPPAQYGIQRIPNQQVPGPWGADNAPYMIYGPVRLRLYSLDGRGDRDGYYLHGDPQGGRATWGCLSYCSTGNRLGEYLWNLRPYQRVPLAVDRPVRRP